MHSLFKPLMTQSNYLSKLKEFNNQAKVLDKQLKGTSQLIDGCDDLVECMNEITTRIRSAFSLYHELTKLL